RGPWIGRDEHTSFASPVAVSVRGHCAAGSCPWAFGAGTGARTGTRCARFRDSRARRGGGASAGEVAAADRRASRHAFVADRLADRLASGGGLAIGHRHRGQPAASRGGTTPARRTPPAAYPPPPPRLL